MYALQRSQSLRSRLSSSPHAAQRTINNKNRATTTRLPTINENEDGSKKIPKKLEPFSIVQDICQSSFFSPKNNNGEEDSNSLLQSNDNEDLWWKEHNEILRSSSAFFTNTNHKIQHRERADTIDYHNLSQSIETYEKSYLSQSIIDEIIPVLKKISNLLTSYQLKNPKDIYTLKRVDIVCKVQFLLNKAFESAKKAFRNETFITPDVKIWEITSSKINEFVNKFRKLTPELHDLFLFELKLLLQYFNEQNDDEEQELFG